MSVKPLSVDEWGSTMMIESKAHWLKPVHLQYYQLGVGGDIPGKNHNKQHYLDMKWGPETHLQFPLIAIGATRENETHLRDWYFKQRF